MITNSLHRILIHNFQTLALPPEYVCNRVFGGRQHHRRAPHWSRPSKKKMSSFRITGPLQYHPYRRAAMAPTAGWS